MKKKIYKIKPTKKQMEIIKMGWKQLQEAHTEFSKQLADTEKWMSKETGIKDLEFFQCDNEFVGVGNVDRTIKLIHLNNVH